jgi:hypothetical protein
MDYVYYKDQTTNQVYGYEVPEQQDLVDEAIANGWENITGSWPLPPTPPTADQNKSTAAYLLSQTDWTTIADVGNPAMSNPYLANQAEFIAYRNTVRQYAVYPEAGNITWPTSPTENWVKV